MCGLTNVVTTTPSLMKHPSINLTRPVICGLNPSFSHHSALASWRKRFSLAAVDLTTRKSDIGRYRSKSLTGHIAGRKC